MQCLLSQLPSIQKQTHHSLLNIAHNFNHCYIPALSPLQITGPLRKCPHLVGVGARKWISAFLTRAISELRMSRLWWQSKIIATLKPVKDPLVALNYRPISLFSLVFKMLEKILLNRLSGTIYNLLPHEQAGSRKIVAQRR